MPSTSAVARKTSNQAKRKRGKNTATLNGLETCVARISKSVLSQGIKKGATADVWEGVLAMTPKARTVVVHLLAHIEKRLVSTGASFALMEKAGTYKTKYVQSALHGVTPGALGNCAESGGSQAVHQFTTASA